MNNQGDFDHGVIDGKKGDKIDYTNVEGDTSWLVEGEDLPLLREIYERNGYSSWEEVEVVWLVR